MANHTQIVGSADGLGPNVLASASAQIPEAIEEAQEIAQERSLAARALSPQQVVPVAPAIAPSARWLGLCH